MALSPLDLSFLKWGGWQVAFVCERAKKTVFGTFLMCSYHREGLWVISNCTLQIAKVQRSQY